MKSPEHEKFPRAILHVDGDSFFVSCELTRLPALRGKPVVTGSEKGIASAMSPEAKARGITRGMRIRDMKKLCPEVIILSSDYLLYSQYARRMYEIVRKYSDVVEEYSIDECFADLTDCLIPGSPYKSYEELAHAIQDDLYKSLDISFSVGLGVNKVTAKIASKWKKPKGFTVMYIDEIRNFLKELPIGKIWGIGSATTVYLKSLGIQTALDLADKSRDWIAEYCDRPVREIYEEFQGNFVKDFSVEREDPHSVQHTRTFHPANHNKTFLWSQLSYHTEEACQRVREKNLVVRRASFFLKTQEFEYLRHEIVLPDPIASPSAILAVIKPIFEKSWNELDLDHGGGDGRVLFRAAGITLSGLQKEGMAVQTLFETPKRIQSSSIVDRAIDMLTHKFGEHAVFLGSSFRALRYESGEDLSPQKKAFDIIYLGKVS